MEKLIILKAKMNANERENKTPKCPFMCVNVHTN